MENTQTPIETEAEDTRISITARTVYDERTLLRFQHYFAMQRKPTWILVLLSTLLAAIISIGAVIQGAFPREEIFYCGVILLLDLFFVFFYFILPVFTVKKSRALGAEVTYTFYDDSLRTHAKTQYGEEQTTSTYEMLHKVREDREAIYLFLSQTQALVVAKDSMTKEELHTLCIWIEEKVDRKKIRWRAEK